MTHLMSERGRPGWRKSFWGEEGAAGVDTNTMVAWRITTEYFFFYYYVSLYN